MNKLKQENLCKEFIKSYGMVVLSLCIPLGMKIRVILLIIFEDYVDLEEKNHNPWFKETLGNTDVIVYSCIDNTFSDGCPSFDFIKQTDTGKEINSKLDIVFSQVRSGFWQEIHFSEN